MLLVLAILDLQILVYGVLVETAFVIVSQLISLTFLFSLFHQFFVVNIFDIHILCVTFFSHLLCTLFVHTFDIFTSLCPFDLIS